MRIFQAHDLTVPKTASNDTIVSLVVQAFERTGVPDPGCWFSFEDNLTLKRSAVQKVLKDEPAFARYESRGEGLLSQEGVARLSTLNDLNEPDWNIAPTPLSALTRWLRLVFVTYKFGRAEVLVPHPLFGEPVPGHGSRSGWHPALRLRYSSAFAQRQIDVSCRVEHHRGGDLDESPPPPRDPRADVLVSALGKVRSGWIFEPESDEEHERRAEILALGWNWRRDATAGVSPVGFPFALPEPPIPFVERPPPLKADLVSAFKPRGYKYDASRSGHGEYVLVKRTARGHGVEVCFDVGPMTHGVSVSWFVHGPGWGANFDVPVSSGKHASDRYPVDSLATWVKIVANAGAVIDHLEATMLPKIEARVDRAPRWWRP